MDDEEKIERWLAPRQYTLEGKPTPQTSFDVPPYRKPRPLMKHRKKEKTIRGKPLDYWTEITEPSQPKLERFEREGESENICRVIERAGIDDDMIEIVERPRMLYLEGFPIYKNGELHRGFTVTGTRRNIELPPADGAFVAHFPPDGNLTDDEKIMVFANGNEFVCVGVRDWRNPRVECASLPKNEEYEDLHERAYAVRQFFKEWEKLPPEIRKLSWNQDEFVYWMQERRKLLRDIDEFLERNARKCVID